MIADSRKPRRVASIDIGTNTLLLLVAEIAPGGDLRALTERCEFGRLGQGLDKSGRLADEAVKRSLAIIRNYCDVMDEYGIDAVAAVGTQALREAQNRDDFVGPAEAMLGRTIEIIAGEREAALVHRAVSAAFPALAETPFVIADVGGGSTEIIVGSGAGVESFASIPIGSVRMSERYLATDPPTTAEMRALCNDIDAVLSPLAIPSDVTVVGTAGTATSMASIALALPEYEAERINGYTMSRVAVDDQLALLGARTTGERRALPGMEPKRADVIVAGAAIFARLLHRAKAEAFLISDRGVRWGLAHELAANMKS